jgi:hypothetical protein
MPASTRPLARCLQMLSVHGWPGRPNLAPDEGSRAAGPQVARCAAAQVVNHFGRAACITTKVGLCHALRELAWHDEADHRAFYPR